MNVSLQTDTYNREPPRGTLLVRKLNLGPNTPLYITIYSANVQSVQVHYTDLAPRAQCDDQGSRAGALLRRHDPRRHLPNQGRAVSPVPDVPPAGARRRLLARVWTSRASVHPAQLSTDSARVPPLSTSRRCGQQVGPRVLWPEVDR